MVALEAIIDAYEEAVEAVTEYADSAWYDPGYDVEFREDLNGVFADDRDVNNLSLISQAVRAGMPVIGWHPARRNAGEEERVLRATRQFTLASQRIMSDFKAGTIGPDRMQAALSAAFVRQARNSFIAGKRALGNLQGLTAADDIDIARAAQQAGLGDKPDPRGLGALLARAMDQTTGTVPDDFRDRLENYIGQLIDTTMRRGFGAAVDESAKKRAAERAESEAAVTQAKAAAVAAKLDPDAEVWEQRLAQARTLLKKRQAEEQEAARRDRAARAALVAAIRTQMAGSQGKLRDRLGKLLRAVLGGRLTPQEAAEQLQELIREEARRAYMDARRRGGGPPPRAGTTPAEDDALADDGDEGAEDFLADLPTPPPAVTFGMLLYWMFLDPWNLVDPDVIRFFDRKLRGLGERFYSISKMGEKAAFRIGVQAPAISQIEAPPATLAHEWSDTHPPVDEPTPLGETVLVWWMLGDAAHHCPDCLTLAESSPYSLDVFNQLGLYPGSGHTECTTHCRCALNYDVASTVCGDGMSDEFWESDAGPVFIREASSCHLPIDVDALAANQALDYDSPQVSDEAAFDWDADIAQSITFGRPGVGIPEKARWLLAQPPGEARYIKVPGTDGAGPVLTQRFQLDGATYVALFQTDDNAIRYITGFIDEGPALFHHEFTVASMRHLAQMASDAGKRLDFDPRLINPGMRAFLKDIGATAIDVPPSLPQRLPDLRIPGVYPAQPLPAGALAPPLGALDDYAIPVMPAWERPTALAHTWNDKAVIQVGFRYSADRREAIRRLRELLDFKRPIPKSYTTAQIDSIVARAEVLRSIGFDTSIGTGLRSMDDAGLAGEALRDGTIKLKPTAGLAGEVTAADSFGDLWAHEYGHLVAERLRATEPGFEAKMLDWAGRNTGITLYANADSGESFAELFAILTRADYTVGRIDGDLEIWAALRRSGLWKERTRVPALVPSLPVFPEIPNLVVDGKLLPGWTDLGQKAADKLGGTSKRTILRDASGQEWLFKPDGAEAEIAGSAITRLFGLNAPPVSRVLYGTEWGSVQPIIGRDATSFIRIMQASPYEQRELFANQLVDYLIGNLDGHSGNYLRALDGHVWAIDKAFAFRAGPYWSLGKQQTLLQFMDEAANHVTYNGVRSLMSTLTPDDIAAVLARFDIVSDDSFRTLARIGADSDQAVAEMLRRKSVLRSEVEALFDHVHGLTTDADTWPLWVLYAGSPRPFAAGWDDWAKTRRFKMPKLGMVDELKPPSLAADAILKPKASGFFKAHSPAQVRDAVLALPKAQRPEAELLIRNVVKLWQKDVTVIPTDWQVWMYRGGTFSSPSLAVPPGPGLSTPSAYISKVTGGAPTPQGPYQGTFWQGAYKAGPPPEKIPTTPWPGEQWLVPKEGPIDEATSVIAGSKVPLNNDLTPWSGTVAFDEPGLPEGAVLDWQRKELQERAEKSWWRWEDVKEKKVDYAIVFGKAESDAAIAAGLVSEKLGDNWYVARGKKAMRSLRDAVDNGVDVNSDWFWTEWLGYSKTRLDAIDAYDASRKAKGLRAGVIIVEPDGRVWFQAPRNQYAGYENTWSKGGIDAGETPAQAAVREAREELGIGVELDDYLGDFLSTDGGSITRYYIGHRVSGGPRFAARKETYAIRLGTPEQVRPVMLRYGKLDKRDTAVLDAFLDHQGLPPVAPPSIGARSLGRSIDDVATPRSAGMPSVIGYNPEEAIALGVLYEPKAKAGLDGLIWDIDTPWGHAQTTVDGNWWTTLAIGNTSVLSVADEDVRKIVVGTFLGVAYAHPQGLRVTIGSGFLDHLQPVLEAAGVSKSMWPAPPGINGIGGMVHGYELTADQLTQMVKLLEDGSVLSMTPTMGVSAGSAAALAQTLSPPDPLGPVTSGAAHTGAFSAVPGNQGSASFAGSFGYDKSTLHEAVNRFLHEPTPGKIGSTYFPYKAPNLLQTQHIKFIRSGQGITVGPVQTWHTLSTPADRAAYLLDSITRWADEMLDPSQSIEYIALSKKVVAEAKLEEVLTAFGITQTENYWRLTDPSKVGALNLAIIADELPDWVSVIPSSPLAHGAQATAASPAVAHVMQAAPSPVTSHVTSPAPPPFAAKYDVPADELKSLLSAGPYAGESVIVPGKSYQHWVTDPATQTTIGIDWQVTAQGNLRMMGFTNTGTHEEGSVALIAWLHDVASHMKANDLGKAEHLAATFTDEVWSLLPPKMTVMLNDAGAHVSNYGGVVLGRSSTLHLIDSIDSELASWVPLGPGTAIPTPVAAVTPPPTVGLAAKVGYDPAIFTTSGSGWGQIGHPAPTGISFQTAIPGATPLYAAEKWQTELSLYGPTALLQSSVKMADGSVAGIGTKTALNAYVGTLKNIPNAIANIPNPPTGGWTFMVPSSVVQAQPALGDFLKQAGASVASDGSLFFKDDVAQAIATHLTADTLPIPTAGIAAAAVPPGLPGTISDPADNIFWHSFANSTPKVTPSAPGFLLEWEVYDPSIPVGALIEGISPPTYTLDPTRLRVVSVIGNDTKAREAALMGAVMHGMDGTGLEISEQAMSAVSSQMAQQLADAGATLTATADGMFWRLDVMQSDALRLSYTEALQQVPAIAPSIVVPPGLPTSKTILGSGAITEPEALTLKMATADLKKSTSAAFAATPAGPMGKWNWYWPSPEGGAASAKITIETGGTVVDGLGHAGGHLADWEALAVIQDAPDGYVLFHPDVVNAMSPDLVLTLMSTSPHTTMTGFNGAMMLHPQGLTDIKAQLALELTTASPSHLPPPPSVAGVMGGATVADPLAQGTMPLAFKADLGSAFDPVSVSEWTLVEEKTVGAYAGTTGVNTTMKIASYGDGSAQTAVAWRRLGNGLEVWKADTGGFAAHMRRMNEMLKANPKLTGVTIKPGALSSASQELRDYLEKLQYGISWNGGKLHPSFVELLVSDLDADVLLTKAVPPAVPLSPLGSIHGYVPSQALQSVAFSEDTFTASFLTGTNTTLKRATYGAAGVDGTRVEWRRLGNNLQVFHISSGPVTASEAQNHILAHIRRMAEQMDGSPKLGGLTFVYEDELPQAIRDALSAFGGSSKNGKYVLTRQQVLDVRAALQADNALPPAALAAPVPKSVLTSLPDYMPEVGAAYTPSSTNIPNHPLLSGKNTTMKVTAYMADPSVGANQSGFVAWRRLGNRLEVWDGDIANPNVLAGHLKYMAEQFDASDKLDGLVFKKSLGNAMMSTTLIDDFGATLTPDGFIRMTPDQVKAVRDALLSDAGLPSIGGATTWTPPTLPAAAMPAVTPMTAVTNPNLALEWPGYKKLKVMASEPEWKLLSTTTVPLTDVETKALFLTLLKAEPNKSVYLDSSDFYATLTGQKDVLKALSGNPGAIDVSLSPEQMKQFIGGSTTPTVTNWVAPSTTPPAPVVKLVDDPVFDKMVSTTPTMVGGKSYQQKMKFAKGKHGIVDSMSFHINWNGTVTLGYANPWVNAPVKTKWAALYHLANGISSGSMSFSTGVKDATKLTIGSGDVQNIFPELAAFAAQIGVSPEALNTYSTATYFVFDQTQAGQLAALIKANVEPRVPPGGWPTPPSAPLHAPATVSTPPIPPPLAPPVKPWTPPPPPPKPPAPAATIWVPPSQTAAAAHQSVTQVVIPDTKSISKKVGYDPTEVKQFLALGSSEVDLGQVTVNLIPQDAKGAKWVTTGTSQPIEARFATRPGYTTLAFTDMIPSPGAAADQQEAAVWASLQKFARDQAERTDDAGAAVAKADLYVAKNIYENRPELRQILLDVGGNEYQGLGTGDALVVTNLTTGKKVGETGEAIGGRDFWRAYGDGIRLDKDQAKRLADALDADTLDAALQGQVLAAAPAPPVTKAVPQGVAENEPIRYLGVHPDHLYLAENEVIGEAGLRAVSRWAGGNVEATWLRTPNVLEWRSLKVKGSTTEATVRAAAARHLYEMLEDLGQSPGMVLDVYADAYDQLPELRDLLLRYKGRQVAVGRDDFIRINASEAGILKIDMQLEMGAAKAPGAVKPLVDPVIWPAPQQLTQQPLLINGKAVKGQTRKAIFKDTSGNEWLFKPGATGRGTHADQAVHELSQLLGLRTPPVKEYVLDLDGRMQRGTLQKLVPDLNHVKRVEDLTPAQQDEMLQHSVLDWLVANDDAHIENIMIDADGHVWAIDKTRSWKGMLARNDSLDPDLNGQGGPGLPPAINLWWRSVRRDPAVLANVSPKSMGRMLRYVESVDDETYLRILKPVLDDWQQLPQFSTRKAFEDAVLRRKHSIKTDLERQFQREVKKVQAANPSAVPKEWRDWVRDGQFKLMASPHEQVLEMMADLDAKFGARYSSSAAANLIANPPSAVASQTSRVMDDAKRYSGGGTSTQGAAAYAGGTTGGHGGGAHKYGAESIRIGKEEGFDYVTQVNTWALLHQIFDPNVTVTNAIAELRASYNPDLGLFIMRRGVEGAGNPADYLKMRARTGFRSVMGGSWGSGPTRYKGGSPQMTMALRPDQVFLSSALSSNAFNSGSGEAEIIFRDLRIEQVLHMDRGSHDWRDTFNLHYDYGDHSSPKRVELYKRLWALYGGPQTGTVH